MKTGTIFENSEYFSENSFSKREQNQIHEQKIKFRFFVEFLNILNSIIFFETNQFREPLLNARIFF